MDPLGRWIRLRVLVVGLTLIPLLGQSTSPPLLASPQPAPAAASAFEQYYNPFGHAWALKQGPNTSVPVVLTPGCHRRGPKSTDTAPNAEEIAFVAKSNHPIVYEECAELPDATNNVGSQRIKNYAAALHALNPGARYVGYLAAPIASTPTLGGPGPWSTGLPAIDRDHEDWFVHQKGRPATREYRVKALNGVPRNDLYDLTNPSFRAFLAQSIATSMNFHGLDGVTIDACADLPTVDTSIPGNEVPDAIVAGWEDGCVALLAAIKAAAPDKLVFFLGYVANKYAGNPSLEEQGAVAFFRRRLAVSDGMWWEDPMGPVNYPPENVKGVLNRLVDRLADTQAQGKYLGIFVNTNVQGQSTFSTTNAADQARFARYYLAAYLTVFIGPKSPLIHYTPIQAGDQFFSTAYFTDWDLDVGNPTGARVEIATGVYRREFEKARVVLNGSNSPVVVALNDRTFLTPEGVRVQQYVVPPHSGMIFMVEQEPPPVCTPRPPVRVVTSQADGGGVNVTVTAGSGAGSLRRIQFERISPNTRVSVQGGAQNVATLFTHFVPSGATQATFTLRPVSGTGVFAQFVAVDGCGDWRSFAGHG